MSPLGDAMSLVHGIERYLDGCQEVHVLLLCQCLWCHVEQLCPARAHVTLHLVRLRLCQRGVQEMRYAVVLAYLPYGIHLVLHQGYQGRYDDGGTLHDQCRQLVAQRLASSRGHKHESVAPFEHVAYYALLVALECVETEVVFQLFCKIHTAHNWPFLIFKPYKDIMFFLNVQNLFHINCGLAIKKGRAIRLSSPIPCSWLCI